MKKSTSILASFLLTASLAVNVTAQTDAPKIYEIVGTEIPVTSLPAIKGRWYNPANNGSQVFRYENGFAYVWNSGRCGEDKRKIVKAYQLGTIITVETGPSADLIRCNLEFGAFQSVDTATKKERLQSRYQ